MAIQYFIPSTLQRELLEFKDSNGNMKIDYRDVSPSQPSLFNIPFIENSNNLNLKVLNPIENTDNPVTGDSTDLRKFNLDFIVKSNDFQRTVVLASLGASIFKVAFDKAVFEGGLVICKYTILDEDYYSQDYSGLLFKPILYEESVNDFTLYTNISLKCYKLRTPDNKEISAGYFNNIDAEEEYLYISYEDTLSGYTEEQDVSNLIHNDFKVITNFEANIINQEEFKTELRYLTPVNYITNSFNVTSPSILTTLKPNHYLSTKDILQDYDAFSINISKNTAHLFNISYYKPYLNDTSSNINTTSLRTLEYLEKDYSSKYITINFSSISNTSIQVTINDISTTFNTVVNIADFVSRLNSILKPLNIFAIEAINNNIIFISVPKKTGNIVEDIVIKFKYLNMDLSTVYNTNTIKYVSNNYTLTESVDKTPINKTLTYLPTYEVTSINNTFSMLLKSNIGVDPYLLSPVSFIKFDIDRLQNTNLNFKLKTSITNTLSVNLTNVYSTYNVLNKIRQSIETILSSTDYKVTIDTLTRQIGIENKSSSLKEIGLEIFPYYAFSSLENNHLNDNTYNYFVAPTNPEIVSNDSNINGSVLLPSDLEKLRVYSGEVENLLVLEKEITVPSSLNIIDKLYLLNKNINEYGFEILPIYDNTSLEINSEAFLIKKVKDVDYKIYIDKVKTAVIDNTDNISLCKSGLSYDSYSFTSDNINTSVDLLNSTSNEYTYIQIDTELSESLNKSFTIKLNEHLNEDVRLNINGTETVIATSLTSEDFLTDLVSSINTTFSSLISTSLSGNILTITSKTSNLKLLFAQDLNIFELTINRFLSITDTTLISDTGPESSKIIMYLKKSN